MLGLLIFALLCWVGIFFRLLLRGMLDDWRGINSNSAGQDNWRKRNE